MTFERMRPHVILGIGIACALWLGPATAVSAHAVLLHSDPPDQCAALQSPRLPARDPRCATGAIFPTPPAAVQLQFSESPQPVRDGITVTGPTGERVATGPVRVEGAEMRVPITGIADDATGTYTVTWEVVSDDTHPARGSFAFSIGQPSAGIGANTDAISADPNDAPLTVGLAVESIARWLHFVGYALGFGSLAFAVFVARPSSLTLAKGNGGSRAVWSVRRLVGLGITLLLLAEPLELAGQVLSLSVSGAGGGVSGIDGQLVGDLLASSFGRVLAQRTAAAVLLWVLLGILDSLDAAGARGMGEVVRIALVAGVALAVVDGEASHAGDGGMAWLGYAANTAHVAAMGVWLGGLVALAAQWRSFDAGERAGILRRFGRLAGGALAVLVVSGGVMAVLHLSRPADLFTSAYGRALIAKLMVLLDALLLARAGTRLHRGDAAHRVRWWLLEGVALAGVLAFAALLVSLPPP